MEKPIFIILSLIVKVTGILIILSAFSLYVEKDSFDINKYLLFLYCGIIVTIGLGVFKFGKRIRYIPTRIKNPQLPLKYSLYLRSFNIDDDSEKDSRGKVSLSNIFPYLFFWGFRTQEQQLAMVVNKIAPLVTAIKPGESLPHRGAIRYIITKENWEDELPDLINSATLIVIRLGKTKSLQWEIEYCIRDAIKHNCSEKLVFILPSNILIYDYYFLRKDLFPKGFVDIKDYFTVKNSDTNSDIGIVYFDENWTTKIKFIDYKAKYVRFPLEKNYRIAFEYIFKRFNVKYSHPGKPFNYIMYNSIKILTYFVATGILFFLAKLIYTSVMILY